MRSVRVVTNGAICIVIASAGLSVIARADLEEQKVPCSAADTAVAQQARETAREGINKAIEKLNSTADADIGLYVTWFGAPSSDAVARVKTNFETALTLSHFSGYWCPLSSVPELVWDVGDVAAVHVSAPGQVFLTPDFFDLAAAGADSRAGTLVHELAHLAGVGLKPEVYGTTKAKSLAASDPARARNNADNYQYFVETILFAMD